MPTYISIPQTLLVAGTDTFVNTAVNDVWVFHDRDAQGVYPVGTTFPVVPGERDFFTFIPGVWDRGDVELRKQFPFWTLDTATLRLEPRETLRYVPTFRYAANDLMTFAVNEDFEGVGVSLQSLTQRSDSTLLVRTSESAFTGVMCGKAVFDSTRRYLFVRTNRTFSLPADDRQVWAEVAYKGTIKFGLGLLYDDRGTDLVVNEPYVPALPNDPYRWQIVCFDLTNLARAINKAGEVRLFLTATSDGASRTLFLDRIRLMYYRR
jgi:hypothetical protein